MSTKSPGNHKVTKCHFGKKIFRKNKYFQLFSQEIPKWIEIVSKAAHRASFLLNCLLIDCCKGKQQFPNLSDQTFFRQLFCIEGSNSKKIKQIQEIYVKYFSEVPTLPTKENKVRGQVFTYASQTYQTNFDNHLLSYFGKIKNVVTCWCEKHKIIVPVKSICYSILDPNYKSKVEFNEKVKKYIRKHQSILFKDTEVEKVTERWVKTHRVNMVRYFYKLLRYSEKNDLKLFSLAPINKISRKHITIDTDVLFKLLTNVGCMKKEIRERKKTLVREDLSKYLWNKVFKLSHLATKNYKFTNMIQTDGVNVSVHFERKQQNLKTHPKNKHIHVIAIDPGRTNLIYGIDEENKRYVLTRKTYYNNAGIYSSTKRAQKRHVNFMKQLKIKFPTYKDISLKTSSIRKYQKYIEQYILTQDLLWKEKLKKVHANEKFRAHRLKNKALDNFLNSMKKQGKQTVLAYGASKFASTGKGEISVPVKYIAKMCEQRFHVEYVDEFRTSRLCNCCGKPLIEVKEINTLTTEEPLRKSNYSIRGLRWCNSNNCRRFLNRDENAAKNILKVYSGINFSNYLTRDTTLPPSSKAECKKIQGKSCVGLG